MAVKTNITINIVEPGSDVPVPDTGLFTHGIGGTEATIILSVVLVLAIASIVLATYMYRKHKKQGRTTKLVHIIDQTKAVVKSKKRITIGLSIIALLVSACTFTAFMLNTNKSNTSAIEGNDTEQQSENTEQTENTNNLTINAESKELTIEVKDQPVFAVLPVQVTVEEATAAGYTLTAYTDNTDLVSTTNPNNKIPMVTVEGDELASLQDNTWGLALDNEPTAKDNKVYTVLSTDQTNPTLITDKDYEETPANDTTTIYYGFYITPDMPVGTYEGGEINYTITTNPLVATVTFDGNGLYFNGDPEQTQNVMRYLPNTETSQTAAYSRTPNLNTDGEQSDFYGDNLNVTNVYSFASNAVKTHIEIIKSGNASGCGPSDSEDYFSFWAGNHPDYTAKDDYNSSILAFDNTDGKYVFGNYNGVETDVEGSSVTFSYTTNSNKTLWCPGAGYGYYAVITAQDADGNNVNLIGNESYRGEYLIPSSNKPYKFLGWSTDKNATVPTFVDENDISNNLDLTNNKTTIYAIWQEGIAVTYNGNGADTDIDMNNVGQYGYAADLDSAGLQVDLLAPNFKKRGYGFVGWSTDVEAWDHLTDNDSTNNPIIYGPNQTITIDEEIMTEAGENRRLTFNAVWAPAETDNGGNSVFLQDWQGCNSLTTTTYDSTTNTLIVDKNTITALTDSRDGNIYTIARLVDGNCWMIENLRLADAHADENGEMQPTVLTTRNTNNPTITQLAPSINSNDWCDSDSGACYNRSYLDSNNTTNTIISPILSQDFTNGVSRYTDLGGNIYSYGNYYNWYSATAGKGTFAMGAGNAVDGDICPAGWQLPYGGKNDIDGSFYHLRQLIGGYSYALFPINFSDAGRGYWASTVASGYYRNWYAHFASNNSWGDSRKSNKNLVRCIMRT